MKMRKQTSPLPRAANADATATKAVRADGDKSFLRLALPPAEIADHGEVRLGCSVISGQFPTIRKP
jgi:hypothetical protein